jgi:hypothetical protein
MFLPTPLASVTILGFMLSCICFAERDLFCLINLSFFLFFLYVSSNPLLLSQFLDLCCLASVVLHLTLFAQMFGYMLQLRHL